MESKHATTFFAALALIGYLFVGVFGLFHMGHMGDMSMSMSDCPYVTGTQSMCDMNVFSHITAWRAFSNVVIPSFAALIFAVIVVSFFIFKFAPLVLPKIRFYIERQRKRIIYWYQELFSQGILNPKIPQLVFASVAY